VRAEGCRAPPARGDGVETIELPVRGQRLALDALREELARRGVARVFVEGGGITVSAFLAAGLLQRLHLAVSPLLIGEGRRAVSIAGRRLLDECLRPARRIYRLGDDVLFDLDLLAAPPALRADDGVAGVVRIA
jgi:riboflavin biosynthesis pyrimidine reductase